MRPQSIIRFEQFYLGAIVLGLVNSFLNWDTSLAQMQADPAAAQMFGSGFLMAVTAIGVAIQLLLWFFIARKASVVAKWILVVFFLLGLLGVALSLASVSGLPMILSLLVITLQGLAVYMLFRPDAVAWLNNKGR